ncbi:hypothetical protein LSH36_205g04039 [Paralvinella palmiformis]|uniref:Uncharacterized protein n=1 Tax=Paralvinella palmiformis TaxID=53620 RepID=A0AAD9N625_9ANNE|nr:hypothetical protein LSH36_205g04039 [Paralvinella palmiformis]
MLRQLGVHYESVSSQFHIKQLITLEELVALGEILSIRDEAEKLVGAVMKCLKSIEAEIYQATAKYLRFAPKRAATDSRKTIGY